MKRAANTELEAYERPRIQEPEMILGLQPGDTDAPELHTLPEATRESIRGGALGSGSDARMLVKILDALPPTTLGTALIDKISSNTRYRKRPTPTT